MSMIRIDELFDYRKGSLQSSKCTPGDYPFVTAAAEWKTNDSYECEGEALIFAAAASGSLGRTHYVNGKFISSDLCFILTPKVGGKYPVDLSFYHIIFNQLKNDIVKNTKAGTSKEAIGLGIFGRYQLPYFNIEEQRIIQGRFIEASKTQSVLDAELTNQRSILKKLRQSLLQDAVQGKLVAQDASDEPAAVLFQKIKAEKEALIAAKKLKKEKPLPPIREEEIPFNIPKGWVWCRLGETGVLKRGKSKHRPRDDKRLFEDGVYPFIQTGDVSKAKFQKDIIKTTNNFYSEFGLMQSELQAKGTLCITIAANIAECGFLGFDACVPDSIVCYTSNEKITEKYVYQFIKVAKDQLERFAPATAQKNINLGILNELPMPLAPLSEQRRIVQKLDGITAVCDILEENIKVSRQQGAQLLQTALREALRTKPQAAAKTQQQTAVIVPLAIPENKRPFARQALAGKIIELFQNDSHFTHIKFQKLQYLAEQTAQAELGQAYYMQRAGPHDNVFMHSIPQKLQHSQWYEEKNYRYYPLAKAADIDGYYSGFFSQAKDSLARLFDLLKNANENQCEMVATLYAVWNDRIIRKELITDELLFEDFHKWSDRKLQYPKESLEKCLNWMQRNEIIPVGFGAITKVAKNKR